MRNEIRAGVLAARAAGDVRIAEHRVDGLVEHIVEALARQDDTLPVVAGTVPADTTVVSMQAGDIVAAMARTAARVTSDGKDELVCEKFLLGDDLGQRRLLWSLENMFAVFSVVNGRSLEVTTAGRRGDVDATRLLFTSIVDAVRSQRDCLVALRETDDTDVFWQTVGNLLRSTDAAKCAVEDGKERYRTAKEFLSSQVKWEAAPSTSVAVEGTDLYRAAVSGVAAVVTT